MRAYRARLFRRSWVNGENLGSFTKIVKADGVFKAIERIQEKVIKHREKGCPDGSEWIFYSIEIAEFEKTALE